jgi:hypothetical protein
MTCCGKAKALARKGKNITRGWVAVATGKKYEFTDDRIEICKKCEKGFWISKFVICSICKCPIEAKARVKDEKCPLDKWLN